MILFVLIDGLRPDALFRGHSPNLDAFFQQGAYTLTAQSVMPSLTLPCHMSIFHSVPPTRHGITTNDWSPMARPVVGFFDQARRANKDCAFFYNWEPLRNLSQPNSLHFSWSLNTSETDLDSDAEVAEAALRYIPRYKPDFSFVYFGTQDTSGHLWGWMDDGYLAHLEKTDRIVGDFLATVPHKACILHSDHGGHERMHGLNIPEDMTIPWVAVGEGIKTNYRITEPVSLLDTAPTLARLMGIQPVPQWEGRVIESIFT